MLAADYMVLLAVGGGGCAIVQISGVHMQNTVRVQGLFWTTNVELYHWDAMSCVSVL